MMARLQKLLVAVALAGAFGALGTTATAEAATPTAQASQQKVAVIKIVVQEADGTVVRAPVRAVHWGQDAEFRLTSDEHDHIVSLRPARADGQLSVDVTYGRDGASMSTERSVKVGSRRSVVHKDNGAKVMVTVIPTKVTIETRPVG